MQHASHRKQRVDLLERNIRIDKVGIIQRQRETWDIVKQRLYGGGCVDDRPDVRLDAQLETRGLRVRNPPLQFNDRSLPCAWTYLSSRRAPPEGP